MIILLFLLIGVICIIFQVNSGVYEGMFLRRSEVGGNSERYCTNMLHAQSLP